MYVAEMPVHLRSFSFYGRWRLIQFEALQGQAY